ncbi:MAG TPA: PD-(D/E)XK nuclease family protein [Bdellovibrionota bacterium]|nr:PD-(D/E)XK nuclease family protein [Bdellovibrionota bacterium]
MSSSERRYRDYLKLFEDRGANLRHRDVIVFPDRAVGPSAEQVLMDFRSDPARCQHPWPSPGVFTTHRLARAFDKVADIPAELSKLELIDRWLTLWPEASLTTLADSWDRVDTLLACSTDPEVWQGVYGDAKDEKDPELTDWLPAVVTTLYWSHFCREANLVGSRWHRLERVAREMPSLSRAQVLTLFERNPWMISGDEPIAVHVPLLKNAFPLENEFFHALETSPYCQVIYYRPATEDHFGAPHYERVPQHDRSVRPSSFVITGALRPLAYTLLESEISRWGLDLPAIPESPKRLDYARDPEHPDLSPLREIIARHRSIEDFPVREILAAADFAGTLNTNAASAEVHSRWAAAGVHCISLDDAWALPRASICLVTHAEDFRELFDPLSRLAKTRAPLPHPVNQLLINNHVKITHDADETLGAREFWCERAEDFTRWELAAALVSTVGPAPAPPALNALERTSLEQFSPSSLEDLLRCGYRFYDQRVRRTREMPERDALSINALRRGEWLHRALEDFFKQPDFERDPRDALRASLGENLEKFFGEISSPAYLASLRHRIPKFAEDLALYLENFEFPLQKLWPQRTFRLESHHRATVHGLAVKGKMDRIDFIGPEHVLLWDYKSGGEFALKLSTMMGPSHRKIQWYLYAKMVEQELGVQVVGGGYVQLLRPEKSGIYFLRDHLDEDTCEQLIARLPMRDYGARFLDAKEIAESEREFASAMESASETVRRGEFLRRPLKETLCETCPTKVICGRPYFAATSAEGEA